MITLLGSPRRCCDGVTRRESLKAGALSLLGGFFNLPSLLALEENRPAAARPGKAVLPHTSDSVRRVSGVVLVRWASLTALAQGPSASNRHRRPPRSIVCPEALKT